MRIAVFHNLPTGGGKRHLFEQARELAARGHELHLFALRSAAVGERDGEYLPVAPLCHETHLYGESAAASLRSEELKAGSKHRPALDKAKALPLAREILDALWARRMERTMDNLAQLYSLMAADIDNGGFDVAYIHHCGLMLAPDLLRQISRTPTVFCCHDTQRAAMQWPVETDPDYDSQTETHFRKCRRGRLLGLAQKRFIEGLENRFISNTRAATMVLANSWYSREVLAQGTGVNARVCYPGVDTKLFSPDPNSMLESPKDQIVLSVGALLPTKRHDFVLEAVAAISPPNRPRLEIIGYAGGPDSASLETHLRDRAGETGVDLTIRKEISDEELIKAYREASAVAFAPYLEPFGLAAVEAMACGTPVVGIHEAGVRETVTHGETGLLTGLDRQEFADALECLLARHDLAARFGRRARQDVEERWTWHHSVDTLERYLAIAASSSGVNGTIGGESRMTKLVNV